jgi:hypothetical protein
LDLAVGGALILLAVVGRAWTGPPEARDARPYVGSWTRENGSGAHSLVVRDDHRATLDGTAVRWRLLPATPARVPPSPSLALDLPGGRTLTANRQGDDLVTRDEQGETRWRRDR